MKNPPFFNVLFIIFVICGISITSVLAKDFPIRVDTFKLTFSECADGKFSVNNECVRERLQLSKTIMSENGACSAAPLKWNVTIDLWADNMPDFEYASDIEVDNDVHNMLTNKWDLIKDDNGNDIPDIYLNLTSNSTSAMITLPTIEGKRSKHIITWSAYDNCGTISTCIETIEVLDKKAPTPVCVPLSTAFMSDPDGVGPLLPQVELWAIDFMSKAYDNCTESEDLLYTFDNLSPQVENITLSGGQPNVINIDVAHYFNNTGGLAPYPIRPNNSNDKLIQDKYYRGEDGIQLWLPSSRSSARVLTSKIIPAGTTKSDIDLRVTVWDKMLNNDYCWTTVDFGCSDPGGLLIFHGHVLSISNELIEDAALQLEIKNYIDPNITFTNSQGSYQLNQFWAFSIPYLYRINATYDFKPMKGLDYNDFFTILGHSNGSKLIDNPYQMKAADINDDGKVNMTDAILLFKALKSNQEIGFGPSIVALKDSTITLSNWFQTISSLKSDSIRSQETIQDFIAIKKGDVDGSYFSTIGDSLAMTNYDAKDDGIKISPNPFSDYAIISYISDLDEEVLLAVRDITGSEVYKSSLQSTKGINYVILEANQVPAAGVYLIEIIGEKSRKTGQLVKI